MTTLVSEDWILAEFKGTYRVADPNGHKRTVLQPFHVKVPIERCYLEAPTLRGIFASQYETYLKQEYPGMLGLYQFVMVEATEVDGSKLTHHKGMCHADLLEYIKKERLPINTALFDDQQLRQEIDLYRKDSKGQQHLQKRFEEMKGADLAVSRKISSAVSHIPIQKIDPTGESKSAVAAVQSNLDKKHQVTKVNKSKPVFSPAPEPEKVEEAKEDVFAGVEDYDIEGPSK
ncbi:MAG: hypothetical protein KGI50_06060 [Patescibacteria group bacterium]|nr:hypothetical protein [Patescibacteria group bacterium]